MKKNAVLLGMFSMVLAFGLSVIGCDSGGGGSKKETSRTSNYSELELIAFQWDSSLGAWQTWTGIKLSDAAPNGEIKANQEYIITVTGTTNTPLTNFCVDMFAVDNTETFDNYKDIAYDTWPRRSVSGNFEYKATTTGLETVVKKDSKDGYLQIKNSELSGVPGDYPVMATLTNVKIIVEEVLADTILVRQWGDGSGGKTPLNKFFSKPLIEGDIYLIEINGKYDNRPSGDASIVFEDDTGHITDGAVDEYGDIENAWLREWNADNTFKLNHVIRISEPRNTPLSSSIVLNFWFGDDKSGLPENSIRTILSNVKVKITKLN